MAQAPLKPGTVLYVGANDPNDAENTLEAFLVVPNDNPQGEDQWIQIANGFGADSPQLFLWAMSCLATFHHLQFQNNSGIEID